ncbi:Xaa-Pro dipeptidyl-peptidase [Gimesia aquarii]|uniref:Xaa-Pro dipeptidyl-peptidase n=1 Tax=Gimesia aquarii TaxID=2527964 RepID=A0A517W005_9PLAN|nr:Xaa-Pro dipeptidyl-peptidase [Gimesia aquarii]QDT98591.1 Xaa-Pro dipeptidyl-peptidase [Gimesia aquarii]
MLSNHKINHWSNWLNCVLATISLLLIFSNQTSADEKKASPQFKDGEAQIVKAFADADYWIRHDLWVETEFDSDGDGKLDRMHVSVTRPRQTESEGLKLPAVYISSPYFAGTGSKGRQYFWDTKQELGAVPKKRERVPSVVRKGMRPIISKTHMKDWVPRGYVVVHSSSPGTGLSQGCPTIGGDNESLAPKAVIDWLCGRAKGFTTIDGSEPVTAKWCTGKVGMTGTSFNGTLALAAATTGVEGLEAIIPIAPNTSYYHYYRSNGLIRHPYGYLGEDIDYLYDFVHSGDKNRREHCNCEIRDKELLKQFDRVSGDYNRFWAGRDYLNDIKPVKAAVLMSHAFNDWNVMPEHSVRIFKALQANGVPTQAYFHQGGHGGPPPMKQMNRWFTRYLHGVKNGVEKDPKAWIVRAGAKRDQPTSYADYPNPKAKPVKLFLGAGAPEQGILSINTQPAQGTEKLVDNFSFNGTALAQAEWTEHRLIYVSPKLSKPIHISGTPRISIRLACNKPAANLSVWLVSLPWTEGRNSKITDNIITRGWADPQNHRSLTESEPLKPGQFYDLSFDLQPDDQIIPKGQQLGLMIFSSDRDFTLRPTPGTELTVDLDKTSMMLPIVGGTSALKESLAPGKKK